MSMIRSAIFRTASAVATRSTVTVATRSLYRPQLYRSFAVKVGETRYTKDHEWVTPTSADAATIGITDFAQSELGDVVFVDLPEVGAKFEAGEAFGSVESVKAASSVYAPVSITVTGINEALKADNSLINKSADKDGWMIKVKLSKPEQVAALMDKAKYAQHVKDSKH